MTSITRGGDNMSVVNTLLNELFLNPNPISTRTEIYQQLQDRIFPNKDLFIKYLMTEDSNEQTEIAKHVVQRMCFESHFSPPYSLLLNLLEFENSDANKSKSNNYIPQDHFQHILNTYMLGIYIFFYHPQINKRLTQEFMTRIDEGNPLLNATKDFVSFWKYFCLFHDVSYPLEAAYPWREKKKIILRKDCKPFTNCFNNIHTLLMYEWIASIISHLIVINDLLNDSDNLPMSAFFTNNYVFYSDAAENEELNTESVKKDLSDYLCIDKLFDYDHFKLLSGFIDEKNYIIVVFNIMSGEPVCIRCYDEKNKATKDYISVVDLQDRNEIKNLLESEEPVRNKRYEIKYFIKDGIKSFYNCLHTVLSHDSNDFVIQVKEFLDRLQLNHTTFTDGQCSDLSLVVTSEDLNELIFHYYKKAYGFISSSFQKTPYSGNMLKCIEKRNAKEYAEYMKSEFALTIIEELKALIEQTANNTSNVLQEWKKKGFPVIDEKLSSYSDADPASKYLGYYIKEFVSCGFRLKEEDIVEVTEKISTKMSLEIQKRLSETEGIVTMFDSIYTVLKKVEKNNKKKEVSLETIKLAPVQNPSMLNTFKTIEQFSSYQGYSNSKNEIDCIIYARNKIANKIPGSSIEELFRSYRNKRAETTIDHGLMGSIVLLYSQMLAHCYVPKITKKDGYYEDKATAFLSPLFWSVDTKTYYKKLISNYTTIFSRVFSSILCHNIYPNHIDWTANFNWRFNFREDPCEFYGMFIDALQVWRRGKYHYQSIDYAPLYSMDSYDIKVSPKVISISVNSYIRNISQLKNKLMGCDEYLSHFSDMVRLSIGP